MLEYIGCLLLRVSMHVHVHIHGCRHVWRFLLDVFVCMIDRSTAESLEPQSRFGPLEFL